MKSCGKNCRKIDRSPNENQQRRPPISQKLEHGHKRYLSRRTASNLGGKTQIPSLGLMEIYTIIVVVEGMEFAERSPGHCHHQRSGLVDPGGTNPPNGKIVGRSLRTVPYCSLGNPRTTDRQTLLETTFISWWLGSPATPVEHKTEVKTVVATIKD